MNEGKIKYDHLSHEQLFLISFSGRKDLAIEVEHEVRFMGFQSVPFQYEWTKIVE